VILAGDGPRLLPEHLSFSQSVMRRAAVLTMAFSHEPTLEEIHKRYLEKMLKKYSGHRGDVAKVLGVSERNLYRLIRKFQLH
jgi:transcriptional regulator with PAS, ATPase and Fis domain